MKYKKEKKIIEAKKKEKQNNCHIKIKDKKIKMIKMIRI